MTHYQRARSTSEPTAAAVRPMLAFLLGLVLLALTLNTNAARATDLARYSSWLKSLGRDYEVVQGSVFLMTNDKCPTFVSIFDSCFGQNPASPYIIPQPPVEDSFVNPDYATPLNTPGPHGETTNIIYRLSDQDALVTIVSYPPKAAYLGYVSYAFTREASDYVGITPPAQPPRTVSPDPDRYEIFGSIGNGVNNVTVQNQLGVSPWSNAIVVYITTSNTNLAAALVERAQEHGIDPKSIFIEPVGSNMITGNGSAADDMVTLMRYAVPESTADADNWMSSLSRNVLVYKVSNPTLAVQRYGEISYTPHTVNTDEITYGPSLTTALQQLATLLQSYLAAKQSPLEAAYQPFVKSTSVDAEGVPNKGLVGSYCIQYGVNCLGDSQDTSTYSFLTLRTLGLEETAFVVGVNHTVPNLNNARYVSIGVFNAAAQAGVASASQTNPQAVGFDSGSLTGSAEGVLQALGIFIPPEYTDLMANLPNLYVAAVARDINNPTIAPAGQYTIDLKGTSLIPINTPIQFQGRAYVLPGTTAGGNVDYMLLPLVVAARKDFVPQQ
ncbi:MAG: hypothetical protein ACRD22_07360 [Terriglobia bacterium]